MTVQYSMIRRASTMAAMGLSPADGRDRLEMAITEEDENVAGFSVTADLAARSAPFEVDKNIRRQGLQTIVTIPVGANDALLVGEPHVQVIHADSTEGVEWYA